MYLHCIPLILGSHSHYLTDSYVDRVHLPKREVCMASYLALPLW
uniref:Uncharacterized protein n=1 Tax=Arundo donax TaxID=35708 RepID=A0A0A8ZFP1_ARUDO